MGVKKTVRDRLTQERYVPVSEQYPEIEKTPDNPIYQSVEQHPAYAMVGASRVTSTGTFLYGSDFKHRSFITLAIRRSEKGRGLSNDYYHGRDELIEIAMSEAQWATFISTLNVGFGVPCTLQHINCESVPSIAGIVNAKKQFITEMNSLVEKGNNALDDLEVVIDRLNLSKKAKEELKWQVETARRTTGSSGKFMAEQFGEHVEKVTEAAKVEVNAYMTGVIARAGIKALTESSPPLEIEDTKKSDKPVKE